MAILRTILSMWAAHLWLALVRRPWLERRHPFSARRWHSQSAMLFAGACRRALPVYTSARQRQASMPP